MKLAIAAGSESVVREHISSGRDLEWRDDRGFTPLMIAASRDRAGVCALLLAAGVDWRSVDLTGRDALAIARDVGALNAAQAIEAFAKAQAEPAPSGLTPAQAQGNGDATVTLLDAEGAEVPTKFSAAGHASDEAEQESNDYGDWDLEDEHPPPIHDPTPVREQSAIQRAISDHVPIDDSDDWDDFEANLPEMAAPLARAEDAEFQDALRALVLRAAREGSVPAHLVQDLYSLRRGEDYRDHEAELSFQRVVNELGAEVDDRFEYLSPDDDFRVAPGPAETWAEAQIVDEAIAAIRSHAVRPRDPLRMQRRETQRIDLLTAEQEIELAKAMELAVEAALDALAGWPLGLEAIVRATDEVRAGRRLVTHIAAGGQEEVEIHDEILGADADTAHPAPQEDDPTDDPVDSVTGSTAAMARLERLAALRAEGGGGWPAATSVRAVLGAVDFRRPFLLELSDLTALDSSHSAKAYRAAIADLRAHRDHMTVANLRLVFPIARKYLFSGMPLEDLSQEGNIGLMKAVDRFDWRRGFRFSTMATWWVRQAINRSIPEALYEIRPPVHVYEVASHFKRDIEALEINLGRQPMPREVAERIGMSLKKYEAMFRCVSVPLPLDSAELELELELKRPIADDASAPAEAREISRAVASALESLGKKRAAVIKLRFGLEGVDPWTLEEVGVTLRVTRERARQIEVKAMRMLSQPGRLESLERALGMVRSRRQDEGTKGGLKLKAASQERPTSSDAEPDSSQSEVEYEGIDVPMLGTTT